MAVTNRFGTTAKERRDHPWDKCEWAIVDEVARRTTVWFQHYDEDGPPTAATYPLVKVSMEQRKRAWDMNRHACLYAIRRHRQKQPAFIQPFPHMP